MGTPSEVWNILVRMTPAELERDLAWAASNPRKFEFDGLAFLRVPQGETSEDFARFCHRRILHPYALSSQPKVPREIVLYIADAGAMTIVECALDAADEKGRLAEVNRQIDAICKREGLGENEHFAAGHAPPDYCEACKESLQLTEKIQETILPDILRRYRLDWIAKIYEEDRATFDIMREVGRRLVRERQKTHPIASQCSEHAANILRKHGPDALEKLKSRLAAFGLPPPTPL